MGQAAHEGPRQRSKGATIEDKFQKSPSIIGGTCTFGPKIGVVLRFVKLLNAYVVMNKKFFRKIEICN